MLERYAVNDQLYKAYAYKICGSNELKHDLVNDMYIELHNLLTKDNQRTFSNRFIFLTIRSIYINGIREDLKMPKAELIDIEDKEENYSCNTSSRRLAISKALDLLPFYDRELLLKTHEKSLRKIAKDIGVHYVTLHKEKHKALDNLREICQEKKEVLGLGTPLRR